MSPNSRKKNSVHEYLAQLVMDYDYRTNDEGVLLTSLMIGNDESDVTPESKSVSISPDKAETPDKADHDTSPNGTIRYFMQSNPNSAVHHSTSSSSPAPSAAIAIAAPPSQSSSAQTNGLAYISNLYATESNMSAAPVSRNAMVDEVVAEEEEEEEEGDAVEEEEDEEEEEEGDAVEEFVSNHSHEAPKESSLAKALAAYNRQPEPSAGEVDEALEIE